MKKLLLALALCLCASPVWAQCNGVFQPNSLCGNVGPLAAPPHQITGVTSTFGPSVTTSGDFVDWIGNVGVQLGDTGINTSGTASLFLATPTSASGKLSLRHILDSDLPFPTITSAGIVHAFTAPTSQYLFAITTSGQVLASQPKCGTLSDAVASCSTNTTSAGNITTGILSSARLAWNWQVLQFGPNTTTGTTSTVGVMGGYGGNCKITPAFSTRVFVSWYGQFTNGTNGDGVEATAFYGTGTAPTSGVLVTGTNTSAFTLQPAETSIGGIQFPFSLTTIISGLTPGTAYWLDLKLQALTGGAAALVNVFCTGHEE